MNRKQFLQTTATASMGLQLAGFNSLIAIGPLSPTINEQVDPNVRDAAKEVYEFLKTGLYNTNCQDKVNLPSFDQLCEVIPLDNLDKLRSTKGFEDFGGNKWIQPGFPGLSLLYHLAANPRVHGANDNYPKLEQIDNLEDYIYALLKWDDYKSAYKITSNNDLVLAVFAYEYRTAFKTPGHNYADLVFSRTGIGRIGTVQPVYSYENRCYINFTGTPRQIAVMPARYGLFLAKKITGADNSGSRMQMKNNRTYSGISDEHYQPNGNCDFLLPVRKIFNNDLLTGKASISFGEKHETRKLKNLLGKDFTDSTVIQVERHSVGSSVCIASQKNENLIRMRKEGEKPLLLKVKEKDGANRYFTARYNGNPNGSSEYIEIYQPGKRERVLNKYQYARNQPMYINLSHDEDGIHLARHEDNKFETTINKDRKIPLYEDSICDGYITVRLDNCNNQLINNLYVNIQKAFSIITAPDFFPQVDAYDIQDYDIGPGNSDRSLFLEGGVSSLSNIDLPPRPFGADDNNRIFDKSYTAVVVASNVKTTYKAPPKFADATQFRDYTYSTFLPDCASGIFSPGWDITYSDTWEPEGQKGGLFLSTQGLGMPFVEDMKYCAAMNGMWLLTSPDAARTFQGSAQIEMRSETNQNPTGVLLTDIELGLHKLHPSVLKNTEVESTGWDGEQGPVLAQSDKYGKWMVNFTDLGRSDAVQNALDKKLDVNNLRKLTSQEINFRLNCFSQCIKKAGWQNKYPQTFNAPWVISFEDIPTDNYTNQLPQGIPDQLLLAINSFDQWPVPVGKGFWLMAVDYKSDAAATNNKWWTDSRYPDMVKRRWIEITKIYVFQ